MFATVSMGMVYLFSLSARLSILMLCVVPPVTIVGRMYGRHVRGLSRKTQDALARATEVVIVIDCTVSQIQYEVFRWLTRLSPIFERFARSLTNRISATSTMIASKTRIGSARECRFYMGRSNIVGV